MWKTREVGGGSWCLRKRRDIRAPVQTERVSLCFITAAPCLWFVWFYFLSLCFGFSKLTVTNLLVVGFVIRRMRTAMWDVPLLFLLVVRK